MKKKRKRIIVPGVAAALATAVAFYAGSDEMEIVPEQTELYLPVGEEIYVDMLPLNIKGGEEGALYFSQGGALVKTMTLNQTGEYEVKIIAQDALGKQTECTLKVIGMNAPVILGIRDIYATEDAQIDYLDGISAMDVEDGDVTERVKVEVDEDSQSKEAYHLNYSITDSEGMSRSYSADVTILPEDELQKMVYTRQISSRKNMICGVERPFDSGISEEEDLEGNLDYVRAAVVQLHQASTDRSVSGSGFIMEITEDAVYIVTNRHVIRDYGRWDVFFMDGTKVVGEKLGTSDEYDVGVVKVLRNDIPVFLLRQLMTVHINQDDWNNRLFGVQFPAGYIAIDGSGEVRSVVTGNVVRTLADFSMGNKYPHTLLDFQLTAGDSGSPIFDAYGNLVSMVYGVSHEADQSIRNWGVPLDAVVVCYEQITGRSLF